MTTFLRLGRGFGVFPKGAGHGGVFRAGVKRAMERVSETGFAGPLHLSERPPTVPTFTYPRIALYIKPPIDKVDVQHPLQISSWVPSCRDARAACGAGACGMVSPPFSKIADGSKSPSSTRRRPRPAGMMWSCPHFVGAEVGRTLQLRTRLVAT